MKLPNGYGSVIKMGGHRRNPYMVRKTAGWHYDKDKDKQVQDYIIIGYARTKADGLKMLAEYNENPYDTKAAKMTFSDIYNEWSKRKYQTVSQSNVHGYTAAYRACALIHERTFIDLRLQDLQAVIDSSDKNYPTMKKIKGLFSQMYGFAIKNDICPKDYSKFVDIAQYRDKNPAKRVRDRIPKEDVDRIWEQQSDPYWQIVIMLIYNGLRISEFLDLKKADVDLDGHYFYVRKSKTENSLRIVPIADKVYQFYVSWFNRFPDCDYLLASNDGQHFKYRNYYDSYFIALMEQLGMEYTPHFTRHTTATMLTEAGVDPTLIKKILGHSGAMTMTERVYTHPDIKALLDAINKI